MHGELQNKQSLRRNGRSEKSEILTLLEGWHAARGFRTLLDRKLALTSSRWGAKQQEDIAESGEEEMIKIFRGPKSPLYASHQQRSTREDCGAGYLHDDRDIYCQVTHRYSETDRNVIFLNASPRRLMGSSRLTNKCLSAAYRVPQNWIH